MPPIREYRDLCDGVCLAFLISYYCPRMVPWPSVRVNHLPTVEVSQTITGPKIPQNID